MGLWQFIVISVGLSLDVFAYCLYKGAMVSEVRKTKAAEMTGVFTGFQAAMLLLGSSVTRIPAIHNSYRSAGRLWSCLAAVTFFCLGAYMIIKSVRNDRKKLVEKKQDEYNYKVILIWALITSIDALIAGVGFGFMGLGLLTSVLIVGLITAAAALAGLVAGYWLGCGPRNKLVIIGGCLVLIGGADLLVHYLGLIS